MRIEQLAIADLTPADYNPRKDLKPGDPGAVPSAQSARDGRR
ncbi:hypothetical protein HMPREF1279_02181 [Propionibacterium sp. KPL1852]|nr:hypothetical protein HMPREF1271_02294 [Propionibacterium sp. KPL1838]ERS64860.1 hypothetical protein HMPREF1279_02181 [Propionibacterium sp. KPL1852]